MTDRLRPGWGESTEDFVARRDQLAAAELKAARVLAGTASEADMLTDADYAMLPATHVADLADAGVIPGVGARRRSRR